MKLVDPATLSPADLGLCLAQLMETDPGHELVLAARLALEIGDARRAEHRARRETAWQVHGGDRGHWERVTAAHIPFDELQRRRGVETGPDGRPRSIRSAA